MKKSVKVSELMPLVKEAASVIIDWTVGFVKALDRPSKLGRPTFSASIAGTGVLVTAGGRHAILTADHVIKNLPDEGPVGLVLLDRRGRWDHRFLLDMAIQEKITVGRGKDEGLGPDLALLALPDVDSRRLEVKKSFYNLTKRKETMRSQRPPNELAPWVTYGFIAEMTEECPPPKNILKNYTFKVLSAPVTVARSRNSQRFDYFSIEVNSGEPNDVPESYEGYSGSGIWHMKLSEQRGRLLIQKVELGGIAFYQSPCEKNQRFIECHGYKSIYEITEEVLSKNYRNPARLPSPPF